MKTSIGQLAGNPAVAALHLWQKLRRFLLLDQGAGDAAQAEVDGERQSGRAGPDDEYGRVHSGNVIVRAIAARA
jgi:hypothetical protein